MADAKRKGRISRGLRHSMCVPRGERNHLSKLTWTKVREIRRRRNAGESSASLAKDFDCDVSTIRLIVRGVTWQNGVGHYEFSTQMTSAHANVNGDEVHEIERTINANRNKT